MTLCLVLNLAIFYLELQTSFLGRCRGKILQKAITAANLAKNHYTRRRTKSSINFTSHVSPFQRVSPSGEPVLPRYRRAPARLDDGAPPHRFKCPKDYYRVQYYEACDKIKTELESRFNQAKLKPVSNLEKLLCGSANSDDFSEHLEELQRSCFVTDIDCGRGHQIYLVHDAMKLRFPKDVRLQM